MFGIGLLGMYDIIHSPDFQESYLQEVTTEMTNAAPLEWLECMTSHIPRIPRILLAGGKS